MINIGKAKTITIAKWEHTITKSTNYQYLQYKVFNKILMGVEDNFKLLTISSFLSYYPNY